MQTTIFLQVQITRYQYAFMANFVYARLFLVAVLTKIDTNSDGSRRAPMHASLQRFGTTKQDYKQHQKKAMQILQSIAST